MATPPTEKPAETPRANHLRASTSPYLRQHADNPVHWHEWGDEALARAAREDKPILLSVGYSACHWCHVMAHESFEDDGTAAVMNEHFINIKVDREERPDIDAIYQKVPQLMGQGGGWPLTVFLTPDGRPFYGGTYFPPRPNFGRPSFRQVLGAVSEMYRTRRKEVDEQCDSFMEGFADVSGAVERMAAGAEDAIAPAGSLPLAARQLVARIDPKWGGFGDAPKFPNPTATEILLRVARARDGASDVAAALRLTLARMWQGGIYDHLRGGFARYAVDRRWLVPHFEKMLYDNAQLLPLYAEAAVLWPEDRHLAQVTEETLAYLEHEMRTPEGTFYASTDADSEGVEGKFFCWTPAQVDDVLGQDLGPLFAAIYGVTEGGNFEHGWSILNLERPLEQHAAERDMDGATLERKLADARGRLLAQRNKRIAPHRDDKVLTSWNALLISGLCRASAALAALGNLGLADRAIALAVGAATVLRDQHVSNDGRVMRAGFEGRAHTAGVLDDIAFLGRAFLDVHEATLEPAWQDAAATLAARLLAQHARPGGGFYLTAADAEPLIERSESLQDAAIPSGMGVAVELLLRLDAAGHAPAGAREAAESTLGRISGAALRPFAFASALLGAELAQPAAVHVKVRGPSPSDEQVRAQAQGVRLARLEVPHAVSLSYVHNEAPASAIVCRGQVCSAPLHEISAIQRALDKAS